MASAPKSEPDAVPSLEDRLIASVREARSKRFITAWLRWRGTRALPLRSALDLADVKPLLALVMLTEVRGPDEVLVRLAGSQLGEYLGYELTGRNLLAFTVPADRPLRSYRFLQMSGMPCGSVFEHQHVMPSGRVLPSEVVILPIDPDEPGKPRVLMHSFAPLRARFKPGRGPDGQEIPIGHLFRFLDVGFGMPESTEP